MSSIGTNGNINDDLLKENINSIEGLNEKVNEINYDLTIKVDGYEFQISSLGKVTSKKMEDNISIDILVNEFKEGKAYITIIFETTDGISEIQNLTENTKIDCNGETYITIEHLMEKEKTSIFNIVSTLGTEIKKEIKFDYIEEISYTFGDTTDEYDGISGKYEEIAIPYTGYYRLEVWGAQGGSGGNGGYSSGYVKFEKEEKLYVYVGGKGLDRAYVGSNYQPGGFNGGGNSGIPSYYSSLGRVCDALGSGGGATDIRKVKATEGNWYDVNHENWETDESLLSRIIVAGGGRSLWTEKLEEV